MNTAETMVADILTGAEAQKIKSFTFAGKHFGAGTFYNIRNLIECGFIKVVYEAQRNSMCEYEWATNTLFVGFQKAYDLGQKAIVIHESVHAVYDMVKMKMTVADSESIAYIVQCQYARANNSNPDDRLYSSDKKKDKVFEIDWNIAGKVLQGYSPTYDECEQMRAAVTRHPYYAADATHTIRANG